MKLSAILIVALIFVLGQAKKTEDKATGALARRLAESENVIAKQQQAQTDGQELRICHGHCCHRIFGRNICHPCIKPCPKSKKVCRNVCHRVRVGNHCKNIRFRYVCGWRWRGPKWCHRYHRICRPKYRNRCHRRCSVAQANQEAGDLLDETLDESAKEYYTYGNVEDTQNAQDEQTQAAGVENMLAKQPAGIEAVLCRRRCCRRVWFHNHCWTCLKPCHRICKRVCGKPILKHICRTHRYPCGVHHGWPPRTKYCHKRVCFRRWHHNCHQQCRNAAANEPVGDFESLDESAKDYYTDEAIENEQEGT